MITFVSYETHIGILKLLLKDRSYTYYDVPPYWFDKLMRGIKRKHYGWVLKKLKMFSDKEKWANDSIS